MRYFSLVYPISAVGLTGLAVVLYFPGWAPQWLLAVVFTLVEALFNNQWMYDNFLATALVSEESYGFLNTSMGLVQTVSNLIAWSFSGFLDVPGSQVLIASYVLMVGTAAYSVVFARKAAAGLREAGGACAH